MVRFVYISVILSICISSCGNPDRSDVSTDIPQSNNTEYNSSEGENDDEEYEEEPYYNYDDDGNQNDENDYQSDNVYEGEYCAEVTYYNPNTRRESEYTLTIEVNNNELEKIDFPKGWLDNDHFFNVEFDEDGYVNFTSDKGYDYSIQIISESNSCFENVPMAYQCIGTTEDGVQCENLTDNPSGNCWQHEDQE